MPRQQQIPFGEDNKKSKSNGKSKNNGKSKYKGKSKCGGSFPDLAQGQNDNGLGSAGELAVPHCCGLGQPEPVVAELLIFQGDKRFVKDTRGPP